MKRALILSLRNLRGFGFRLHLLSGALSIAVLIALSSSGAAGCAKGYETRAQTDAGSDPVSPADGGTPRSATDSGTPPMDASTDAGAPECTVDADCDDELACTGIESCVDGRCQDGTPMTCNDGVACTTDGCIEPGECAHSPNDDLCSSGLHCDRTRGCTAECSEDPCRLVGPQCGCPTGFGCYLDGSSTRLCTTAGTTMEGGSCSSLFGCAPGLLCLDLGDDTTSIGGCQRYCESDLDCSGAGSLCILNLADGSGGTLAGIQACTRSCSPITNAGCPSGTKCFIGAESEGAMRDLTHCAGPIGSGTQGTSCSDDTECAAGYLCADPDGTGALPSQCLRWCNVAGGLSCEAGTECLPFGDPLIIGTIEYGACL